MYICYSWIVFKRGLSSCTLLILVIKICSCRRPTIPTKLCSFLLSGPPPCCSSLPTFCLPSGWHVKGLVHILVLSILRLPLHFLITTLLLTFDVPVPVFSTFHSHMLEQTILSCSIIHPCNDEKFRGATYFLLYCALAFPFLYVMYSSQMCESIQSSISCSLTLIGVCKIGI